MRAGVAEQSSRRRHWAARREEYVLPNRGSEPTDSPPRVPTQHRRGCQASPVPEQAGVPVVATALAQGTGGSGGGQDRWRLGQRRGKVCTARPAGGGRWCVPDTKDWGGLPLSRAQRACSRLRPGGTNMGPGTPLGEYSEPQHAGGLNKSDPRHGGHHSFDRGGGAWTEVWVPRAMDGTHSARRRKGRRADRSCSQRSAQCLEQGRRPQAMSVP